MLLYAMTGTPVKQWFKPKWDELCNKLTHAEFERVVEGLTAEMIDTHREVTVPGFKAGADWTGKPWGVLWDRAGWDEEKAAIWMGLMAAEAFKRHPATWYTETPPTPGTNTQTDITFRAGQNVPLEKRPATELQR